MTACTRAHKERRETEKARQLFLECEQTYSAVYGPDHSETQDAARQYEEALVELKKGLDVLVTVHGHEHRLWPCRTATWAMCIVV